VLNQAIPSGNLFTSSREEDRKFQNFPEGSLRGDGIYKVAEKYLR
jgi:hypothetical protein